MASFTPRGILLHRCETGNTGAEVQAAESKGGLGYHFYIRRDGTVDALCPTDQLCWHAMRWSHICFGIALHGDFHLADKSRYSQPTTQQLANLQTLALKLWNQHGLLPIMGHTDLPGATTDPNKICPGENLNVRAIQAAVFSLYLHHQNG